MRERGHLFIPVVIMLVVMYSGYSAPLAALAGTLACFPVAALRKSTRGYVTCRNVLDALVDGARNALAGRAGLRLRRHRHRRRHDLRPRHRVHAVRRRARQGHAAAGADADHDRRHRARHGHADDAGLHHHGGAAGAAIIKLGVIPPAAHMFAFYFAILSAITPPVALAVFAAAGIAKSDLWTTGWAAVQIGAAGFIMPFMFIYEPPLLMIGAWPTIVSGSLTASAGIVIVAAGLHGYFITRSAPLAVAQCWS